MVLGPIDWVLIAIAAALLLVTLIYGVLTFFPIRKKPHR